MNDIRRSRAVLIEKVKSGISTPFNKYLIDQLRPCVRFRTHEIRVATKLSKIGGVPFVENDCWPKSQKTDQYLSFVAQIDLSEIAKFDLKEELPKKGLLSFYINLDSLDEGRVIYSPESNILREASLPEVFVQELERKQLPFFSRLLTKAKPYEVFEERQLYGSIEYMIPWGDSLQVKLYHLENGTASKNMDISEQFIDEYVRESESDHHLLGYYVGLQESIYELNGFKTDKYFPEISEDSVKKGLEWRLLFQLDSDRSVNINWLDRGKLLFFIHREDLAKRNFEDVKLIIDST